MVQSGAMEESDPDFKAAMTSLRRQWAAQAVLSALAAGAAWAGLRAWWGLGYATGWLATSGLVLGYLLWTLWRLLRYNQRQGEQVLLPSLGAGNTLTFVRGVLVAGLAGFLFWPRSEGWAAWIPGVFYTVAGLLDYLDGYLARITNHTTRLGELLDLNVDGIGVLAATLLVVQYGQAPWWYLLVGLVRYLFVFGLWLRRRLKLPIYDLPPSIRRRAFAGLQMGFLFVMLWPVFTPPATHLAALVFSVPFLGGFLYDWLLVCSGPHPGPLPRGEGEGGSQPAGAAPGGRWLRALVVDWLPVGWAAIVVLAVGSFVWESRGEPLAAPTVLAVGCSRALVLALLALGRRRSAAILGPCLVGCGRSTPV
jgi:CDP-diacylglycerol--glycerol-3-phosphate 3-phosphatidyltransferase